ncbi:MAG: CPBP family intramembrane metalloprotease [Lachnospiraceae bacterium]|nr:CPBP family intramembrane metalloprotease [Lachnospiraceae bacterium]
MEENKKYLFDQFIIVIFLALFLAILGSIIGSPIQSFGYSIGGDWMGVLAYLGTIGEWAVCLLFMFLFKPDRKLIAALGHGGGNTLKMFLIGIAAGFVMNGSCILVSVLRKDISLYYDPSPLICLLAGVVSVLIQASSEELLCRHIMQRHLRRRYGKAWLEILLPSALFSALHLMNPGAGVISTLSIFVSGVLFGAIICYYDSFWLVCGLHAMWNITQNLLFGLPNSGIVMPLTVFRLDAAAAQDSFSYNVAFGVEGSLMSLLVLLLGAGIVIFLGERKKRRAS